MKWKEMMFKKFVLGFVVLLFLILFSVELRAQDPVMLLTFQDLLAVPDHVKQESVQGKLSGLFKEVHGRNVSIRGFIYRTDDKRWVLAAEPNLKSCCIGSSSLVERQIEVKELGGQVVDSNSVVTLQGVFSVEPVYGDDGVWQRLYVLKKANLVKGQMEGGWLFFILVALCLLGVCFYFLRKSR